VTALWLLVVALLCALPARTSRPRTHGASRALAPRTLGLVAAVGSGALSFGVVGGTSGLIMAGLASAVAWRLVPALAARAAVADASELDRVPLVLDLVATVLRTGQPVDAALIAAAGAAGPRLGDELRQVGGLLRLGAAPADAWSSIQADARLRPVAVVAVRSADSGMRLATGWSALARELRAEAVSAATARAAGAGTWVMAPLGLCFLPAFVCLGIAPVVVGIATGLINGGTL
jgi:hypothetical protein